MTASDPGAGKFVATPWTVVLAAVRGDSSDALGRLCQAYWYPLYSFVRRQGHDPHTAEDMTQAFFTRLVERRYLDAVDPARGKFRSFLLAALKHFLANERERADAQKRGGAHAIVSIDEQLAESRYSLEAAHHDTPETIYERNWALALLDRVLHQLRDQYTRDGKARLFDELKATLSAESDAAPYAEIASRLNSSESAIKVAVHRLRHRYRQLLRTEIAHTVEKPEEIEDEIRHLFAMLSK
jgi:RNA polymerase sigma factor (sigma-70 family)